MPISPSELGLKNTQQPLACAILATGGIGVMLVLARASLGPLHSISPFEIFGAILVLPLALRRLYVGANLLLAVMVDTVGPAEIEGWEKTVKEELLRNRQIWTYQRPEGLIRSALYRAVPQSAYLTPPYRSLFDGIVLHLFAIAAVVALCIWLGLPAIPLTLVVLTAVLARVGALLCAMMALPTQRPSVEVHEATEHLNEAGNPIDLYNNVRMAFERLRENQFQNRLLWNSPPAIGVNATTNQCAADLIVETQPMPVSQSTPLRSPAAFILAVAGALLEVVGWAFLLFPTFFAPNLQQQAIWFLSGLVAVGYGSKFMVEAQRLHYTFRFRSDIIWFNLTGSYVLNKVAVGGGLMGLPSTEGHSIKSDLYAFIRGSRLITECAPPAGSARERLWGNPRPAERTLQSAPRYIVSTHNDPVFAERLDWIVKNVLHYRDAATQLRTPDLQSVGLQNSASNPLRAAVALTAGCHWLRQCLRGRELVVLL